MPSWISGAEAIFGTVLRTSFHSGTLTGPCGSRLRGLRAQPRGSALRSCETLRGSGSYCPTGPIAQYLVILQLVQTRNYLAVSLEPEISSNLIAAPTLIIADVLSCFMSRMVPGRAVTREHAVTWTPKSM